MSQTCPHCAYTRKDSDEAPDWQCPACEKAYAKAAGGHLPPVVETGVVPRRSSSARWLFIVLIIGLAFWLVRPFFLAPAAQPQLAVDVSQPEVVLYATEWCGYCKATRRLFETNGIRYIEHDIEKDPTALLRHQKLGGSGVPLIVVGDEVVDGFNEARLRKLLNPWMGR